MKTQLVPFLTICVTYFLVPEVFGRALNRNDLSVVHTFDTREMCMSRCRTTCTQAHSEDLMMPRWQCPMKDEDNSTFEEEDEESFTNNLLIIIPSFIVGAALFLFICVSCVQRFCRQEINNLTSSCVIEEPELLCYRQALDMNQEYLQAVYQRDQQIRICLHTDILKCIQQSSESIAKMGAISASVHDSETEHFTKDEGMPRKSGLIGLPEDENKLIKGEIVNGQCQCACPNKPPPPPKKPMAPKLLKEEQNVLESMSKNKKKMMPITMESIDNVTSFEKVPPAAKTKESNEDLEVAMDTQIKFDENAPRLMQPGEAVKHLYWALQRKSPGNRRRLFYY